MSQILPDEEALFHEARRIASREARDAYLAQACGGDRGRRDRVEALLRVHEQEPSFLESPAPPPTAARDEPPLTEGPGTVIGPYKLLERIGEGGMGAVYMAEQARPVRRKVALKVIKPGMDTRQVIARFEAERQALALMDHPNIARVLDAGATDSGRPYFVMELVRGVPITDYCDREHLSIPERLDLFVLVCRAVQHAHQKGVIHRDIKPTNVLITLHDGVPVPKVIDFGIAKATGQSLTDKTLYTGFAQLVGTPLYMSPEQAEMSGLDVDTRSDVYSLGVLLYELLTGTTPFSQETFRTAAFDEMRRIIREEEPPTPSTRLSSLGDTLTTVSANRKADPRRLGKSMRGELDWVVMKALEKDRRRRYETANDFAADVIRHLTNQPVEACPPSAPYRFMKFARRNRAALMTAGLVALALIAGTVASLWQAVRATRAERLASQRLYDVRQANAATTQALKQSEEESRKSEAVKEFLVDAFRKPDPSQDGRGLKVVDLLDRAVARLDGEFGGDSKMRGELLDALGHTYHGLGLHDRALSIREQTLAVRQATLGADDRQTVASSHDLAGTYAAVGRTADAIRLEEDTLKQCVAILGPDDKLTLSIQHTLALLWMNAGRTDEGIRLLEQTSRQTAASLGPDHRDTLVNQESIAKAYMAAGRKTEALRLFEQTLERFESTLGPDDVATLGCRNCLAVAYEGTDRRADAIPLLERTLPPAEAKLGADHSLPLTIRNNLATYYSTTGRLADAVRMHEQVLAVRRAKLSPDHPDILQSQNNLGVAYTDAGRAADAIPLLERTLKMCESRYTPNHSRILATRGNLANAYLVARRWAEAEPLFRDLLDRRRRATVADPRDLSHALAGLGRCLLEQGRTSEAESMLRECLAIREKALSDDWRRFDGMALLGGCLLGQKKYTEAEPLLIQGYEGLKAREAKIPNRVKPDLAEAAGWIIRLYESWEKPESAALWRTKLGSGAGVPNAPPPDTQAR
jgi:serine/threonine protein kinase/tetratricopeptide (TPR) repeat protein